MNNNGKRTEDDGSEVVEWKTKCRIIETKRGCEALVTNIFLGPLTIIVISNIPSEENIEAPAYIKFKFFEKQRDWKLPFGAKHNGNERRQSEEEGYKSNIPLPAGIPVRPAGEVPLSSQE